jgi:hypothetical protein
MAVSPEERLQQRQPRTGKEEFAQRGDEIYASQVRPQVEQGNHGKIVAIDIETGAIASKLVSLTPKFGSFVLVLAIFVGLAGALGERHDYWVR